MEVITRGDVAALKAVKGIGAKTAQRILVDLQDKMGKDPAFEGAFPVRGVGSGAGKDVPADNTGRSDALGALCNLGFDRRRRDRTRQAHRRGMDSVEDLVRAALKRL